MKIAEHIFAILSAGIDKAYKAGIKAIAAKNKNSILRIGKTPAFNKFAETKTKKEVQPLFSIDYTAEDLKAIANFKLEAFTVATIGEYDLQEKIKELAIRIIRDHQGDINLFKTGAQMIADRYIRGDWLQTNLTTATNSAYRAAEWIRLQDPAVNSLYPAYKYKTRQDAHVRDEHAALNNKVYRSNDPIWNYIYPPNGWNCRCYVIPLDIDEIGNETIENELRTKQETKEILNDTFPNPKDQKNFMRNSGQTQSIWRKWINEKLSGFTGVIQKKIKELIKAYKKNEI